MSAKYRYLVLHRPFAEIADQLGDESIETASEDQGIDLISAKRIGRLVDACSHYTLWKTNCLVQAFVARQLLKKNRIPCTVYMGVRKNEQGGMDAHAWTRCGTAIVTGKKAMYGFVATGHFGTPVI